MNKKIIYIVIIFICIILLYINLKSSFSSKSSIEKTQVEKIENYNYNLHSNDTDIYKDKFQELKTILEKEEINDKDYATLVAELFVIDFYTLDNKITNRDIGGTEFIHPNMLKEFSNKARGTIYKNITNNLYGDRKEKLQVVKNVKVTSIDNIKYQNNDINTDNAYQIKIDIEYEKDLKYQESVTLTLVKQNEKIYIVEIK